MKNIVIDNKTISHSKKIDRIKIIELINKFDDDKALGEEIRKYINFLNLEK